MERPQSLSKKTTEKHAVHLGTKSLHTGLINVMLHIAGQFLTFDSRTVIQCLTGKRVADVLKLVY